VELPSAGGRVFTLLPSFMGDKIETGEPMSQRRSASDASAAAAGKRFSWSLPGCGVIPAGSGDSSRLSFILTVKVTICRFSIKVFDHDDLLYVF
jgi:hypothetical protein